MNRDYELLRLKSFMSFMHPRVLYFHVDQEPFKKPISRNPAATQAFKDALLEEVSRKKFNKFRSNVAIDFFFASTEHTYPDHINLIKNYVDIIRDTVLEDDRQVSLIESYHSRPSEGFTPSKASLSVRITSMRMYEATHALMAKYSDFNDTFRYSHRHANEDMSVNEVVDLYSTMAEKAKAKGDNDLAESYTHIIQEAKEERALSLLMPYDLPFDFSSKYWDMAGFNATFKHWRNESGGIVISAPGPQQSFADAVIIQAVKDYLNKRGIDKFKARKILDMNLEVINWHDKDVDNIFIQLKKALQNSGLFDGTYNGIRIYRYADDIDPTPRIRIKFLAPMDIFNVIHTLERQVEEKFEENL